MEEVTESDLVEALREALQQQESEDGMTTIELAEVVGCSKYRVLDALHKLNAEQKLRVVRVKRRNLVGINVTVPGYVLKDE